MMPEIFADLDTCSKEFTSLVQKLWVPRNVFWPLYEAHTYSCTIHFDIKNRPFSSAYVPMPKLTPDGYRVVVFHIFEPFGDYIPTENSILRANQIVLDLEMWMDQNRGCIILFNLENLSLHFVRLLVLILKKLFMLTTVNIYHLYSRRLALKTGQTFSIRLYCTAGIFLNLFASPCRNHSFNNFISVLKCHAYYIYLSLEYFLIVDFIEAYIQWPRCAMFTSRRLVFIYKPFFYNRQSFDICLQYFQRDV